MATVAAASAPVRRAARPRFYFHLSLACLATGVLGFAPSYWMQVPLGYFTGPPLLHIHGLFFTAWLLLLVGQNWRIAQGRLDHHRAWGVAGVALASAIVILGLTTAIAGLQERYAQGVAEQGRSFLIVPFASIVLFAGFFAAAMANVRRPEWHRRFVFVATSAMLVPAAARMFQLARFGWSPGMRPGMRPPPPVAVSIAPMLLCMVLIVAGMIYDRRTRGKVHPAWTIGFAVLAVATFVRVPLAETAAWQSFADWTTRIV